MSASRRLLTALTGPTFAEEIIRTLRRWQAEYRSSRMHRQGCRQSRQFLGGSPLRLHLGCGHVYKPGWINIDAYRLPPCTPDLLLDLRRPLPFPDNSSSEVYSEHVFEHIPYPQAATAFLRESYRVLAPGGRTSIGVPDPRPVLATYLADESGPYFDYFFNHPSVTRHLDTKMEGVNWLFRQGGEHQFIYDYPSLEKMLMRAGFVRIVRREFDPLRDSEPRRNETIYVDAWKET
jgi:predicted SAM-dependent methyltransferase